MRILALVKQVPAIASTRYVEQLNRIDRAGVPSLCNPLDLDALEHALGLKRQLGAEVVVATMGPPDAREVLDDAIRLGADRGIHLVDIAFAGADTLATARALAQLVIREAPDLVLCGRITLDGGTAHVGPQVAELSRLEVATEVVALRVVGEAVEIDRETRAGREVLRLSLPALVSFDRGPEPSATPASHPRAIGRAAKADAITTIDVDELGGDRAGYGIRGSATYVRRIDPIARRTPSARVSSAEETIARLEQLSLPLPSRPPEDEPMGVPDVGEIWVLIEAEDGSPTAASLEAIACAESVASRMGTVVVAVVFEPDADALRAALASAGTRRVLHARSPDLDGHSPSALVAALDRLLETRSPLAVIGGWTRSTREWLPRVAARNGLGMTGDFVGLDLDPRPGQPELLDLVWLKPAWSGSAVARVVARSVPSFGTLRAGCFAALAAVPVGSQTGEVVEIGPLDTSTGTRLLRVERRHEPFGDIDASPVLILVGSRLSREDLKGATRLAQRLGGILGGTRAAVESALVDGYLEVSTRSRALSPSLVVALGLDADSNLDAVAGARVIAVHDAAPDASPAADVLITCPLEELLALV